MKLSEIIEGSEKTGLYFVGNVPVTLHCHHFNLFLEQTVEDALGFESFKARRDAAHLSSYRLLEQIFKIKNVEGARDRLKLASEVFSQLGQGNIDIRTAEKTGLVSGEGLHYSTAWINKYGSSCRRDVPIDSYTAGYIAAALELAHGKPYGSIDVTEEKCTVTKSEYCLFKTIEMPDNSAKPYFPLNDADYREAEVIGKVGESEIQSIASKLIEFVSQLQPDARGLYWGFGVYITYSPAEYYNKISYDTLLHLEEKLPHVAPLFESLLRESGHVCGFNTFGGILKSPEWEGLFGRPTGNLKEMFISSCGIARALGFGNWSIEEVSEDKVVVTSTVSYESNYYRSHYPPARKGRCFLFQGVMEATMRLATFVDWKNPPIFDHRFYLSLFKGNKQNCCHVRETHCISKGDPFCRLELERNS